MAWTEPIFDRNEIDILNKTRKAYIAYTDLNRIEENIDFIGKKLNVSDLSIKNWDLRPIPKEEDMTRILNNLSKLCNAWEVPNIPNLPQPPITDYLKFNKIEEIEFILNKNIDQTVEAYRFCGEAFSGEMGVI